MTNVKYFCIIAINYAPEVTGCGPYTTDLAERLVNAGHNVTVITGLPHYPQWRVPEDYRHSSRRLETHNGVTVKRCWIYVPKRMTAVTRIAYELSFLVSAWWKSRKEKPDVVIAVSPALGDMIVGARLARMTGASYGILIQDLMAAATTQSNISGGSKVAKIASTVESRYLRHADSVATITESFSASVKKLGVGAGKIVISPNYSVKDIERLERVVARKLMGWDENLFILTHTGNMGLKQDLGNLIEAIKIVDDPTIRPMLVGDGSQRSELELLAKGDSRIEFMDLVPEDHYSALLAASDVLLINEAPTVTDMSLPSKLTSYEAAGRVILGAVVSGGNTSRALDSLSQGFQVVAGNPQIFSEKIEEFIKGDLSLTFEDNLGFEVNETNRELRTFWALGINKD
jgi:colanic acid biosynthesis glycosyl transferase WcaI